MKAGLGTQLRHIIELLDGAVAASYDKAGLNYRPRFTPIVRALITLESCTINEIAKHAGITQPAATQTIKLMLKADLIVTKSNDKDGRQKLIELSEHGRNMLPQLESCWTATKAAGKSLDEDLGYSLKEVLEQVTEVLEQRSFAERIERARQSQLKQKN